MFDNMDVDLANNTSLSITITFDTSDEVKEAYDI